MTGQPLSDVPDARLAVSALGGRPDGFEELVRRHQAVVFSHVLRLVRNRDDAMELAQDTFLKAYGHLAQYDPARPFRTWLLTIATNTALNHIAARRLRRTTPLIPEAEAPAPATRPVSGRFSPVAQASRRETLGRIDAALERLSAKARAVFQLRYNQGLSCEEISRALGESLSNVKVSLLRTRERLRHELQAE